MSQLLELCTRLCAKFPKRIVNSMNVSCILLILATISRPIIADDQHIQHGNRTCIPAEAEPLLNSSGCYPLVNFTRPFCQNHGVTLSDYIYQTPDEQSYRNNEGNGLYDRVVKLGIPKVSRFFNVDNDTLIKCLHAYVPFACHYFFPNCDGTQSEYKKQKICQRTCLNIIRICGKIWDFYAKFIIRYNPQPEWKKLVYCKLQPYRNAGDSPECWYADLEDSAVAIEAPEWTTKADCLYLNGSSYHGNISVTASGIPCQSWTEQCPHRHTMNTTYPELNNAKNYCRNPKNSGQRPWCFTTDRNKRWEYCDIPKCTPVHGNYGNWSLSSACNVTCGEGFETWTRDCNNPGPKFGGRNCSLLGEAIEYRPCQATPCPVNGGYTSWSLDVPCNVSCGEGMEIWRRTCDNPEPKYEGNNCSELGKSIDLKKCTKKPCPVDGNYSNWTRLSPCSVTCGQGVEIWARNCDNPPGKYGGNCSKQGVDHENRLCAKKPCQVVSHTKTIGFIVAATFVIVVIILSYLFIRRKRRRKTGVPFYAIVKFSSEQIRGQDQENGELPPCVAIVPCNEMASTSKTGTSVDYQNLTTDGDPIPGHSRGVVNDEGDYGNTGPSRGSWYDRLQLFRPLAVDWLRNAQGNVDEEGHHVYDVTQRVRQVFIPYEKLGNTAQVDSAGRRMESDLTYDTPERPPGVILPCPDQTTTT
ncbi:uncharacterized protein LOC114522508 isoform X2 [Dendronephthya gigantea]|uniref:uncharacterized protein LOC114522508 isoform X2 n=1 Tax=Dendronephthya gigantea TaxID=151771 RepID=UPI001069E43C|nr:uncharacterized protein LOC114522508 isoform X2 [Dendronephthya gigantea]